VICVSSVVQYDCLAKRYIKAQNRGFIHGLIPCFIVYGVAILQYANDTTILFQDNKEMSINVKLLW
jgi:sulfite exporter TauE/SafE